MRETECVNRTCVIMGKFAGTVSLAAIRGHSVDDVILPAATQNNHRPGLAMPGPWVGCPWNKVQLKTTLHQPICPQRSQREGLLGSRSQSLVQLHNIGLESTGFLIT